MQLFEVLTGRTRYVATVAHLDRDAVRPRRQSPLGPRRGPRRAPSARRARSRPGTLLGTLKRQPRRARPRTSRNSGSHSRCSASTTIWSRVDGAFIRREERVRDGSSRGRSASRADSAILKMLCRPRTSRRARSVSIVATTVRRRYRRAARCRCRVRPTIVPSNVISTCTEVGRDRGAHGSATDRSASTVDRAVGESTPPNANVVSRCSATPIGVAIGFRDRVDATDRRVIYTTEMNRTTGSTLGAPDVIVATTCSSWSSV